LHDHSCCSGNETFTISLCRCAACWCCRLVIAFRLLLTPSLVAQQQSNVHNNLVAIVLQHCAHNAVGVALVLSPTFNCSLFLNGFYCHHCCRAIKAAMPTSLHPNDAVAIVSRNCSTCSAVTAGRLLPFRVLICVDTITHCAATIAGTVTLLPRCARDTTDFAACLLPLPVNC